VSKDDRDAALPAETGGGLPRWVLHFIYVPDQTTAEALAAKLRCDGFEVESRLGADELNWLVLARHMLIPDEEAFERARDHLASFAGAAGGEYDGWEADLIKEH
jgi:hypothetical protein